MNPFWTIITNTRHSTPLKRWLNPLLRLCGWEVVSIVKTSDDDHPPQFIRYRVQRVQRNG